MSHCQENPCYDDNEMDPPQVAEPDHSQEDESKPTTSVCNSLTITLCFFVGIISILLVVLFILLFQMQPQIFDVQAQTGGMKQEVFLEREKLKELESKISRLKTDLSTTYWNPEFGDEIENPNKRFHRKLYITRWTKFSNGLYYKFFVSYIKIHFADAEEECKERGAQLASTGIRNATIRSEIFTRFSKSKTNTWIGLNQPYHNTTWVWSDGELYDNADMSWDRRSCSTMKGREEIYWSSPGILSCYQPNANVKGYICETRLHPAFQNTQP